MNPQKNCYDRILYSVSVSVDRTIEVSSDRFPVKNKFAAFSFLMKHSLLPLFPTHLPPPSAFQHPAHTPSSPSHPPHISYLRMLRMSKEGGKIRHSTLQRRRKDPRQAFFVIFFFGTGVLFISFLLLARKNFYSCEICDASTPTPSTPPFFV